MADEEQMTQTTQIIPLSQTDEDGVCIMFENESESESESEDKEIIVSGEEFPESQIQDSGLEFFDNEYDYNYEDMEEEEYDYDNDEYDYNSEEMEEDDVDPDDELYYEGLSEEEISKYLHSFTFQSNNSNTLIDRCVVCQMEYEEGENLVALPCDHPFHSDCINKWLHIKKICPICCDEVSSTKFLRND